MCFFSLYTFTKSSREESCGMTIISAVIGWSAACQLWKPASCNPTVTADKPQPLSSETLVLGTVRLMIAARSICDRGFSQSWLAVATTSYLCPAALINTAWRLKYPVNTHHRWKLNARDAGTWLIALSCLRYYRRPGARRFLRLWRVD